MTARRERLPSVPPSFIMEFSKSFFYKHLFKTLLFVGLGLFYCEVLVYYMVLLQCTWPLLDNVNQDAGIFANPNANPLKVMILADTHLLGPVKGHWLDKLRREWQMHRTFMTAMTLHQPEVVVFLGDLLDEGQWSDDLQFKRYVDRFHQLFPKPDKCKFLVAAGNHDVGFHYKMTSHLLDRFNREFVEDDSGVRLVTLEGTAFVIMNSVALYGDSCKICEKAQKKLTEIEELFNCSSMVHQHMAVNHSCSTRIHMLPHYTRPIILQHFPLFRESDEKCTEADSAEGAARKEKFRENWEVLSKDISSRLLSQLNPRAVFDGHSHNGCLTRHRNNIPEWTVPSFNWRNKNNPSFILSVFTPNNFAVSKCYMPRETTIFFVYLMWLTMIILWLMYRKYKFTNSKYAGFTKLATRS